MAVLPMIAIQVWHERDLRNEREGVVRHRVVDKVQQLAAEIRVLREGARQLLLAIAQLEAVKLHQPEACSTVLAKRLTENELSNFSRLWHGGCVEAIIEAQDVDRNHSTQV